MELLPCPFCGCKDIRSNAARKTVGHGETALNVSLYCHKCPCSLVKDDVGFYGLTEDSALKMLKDVWNKRVDD